MTREARGGGRKIVLLLAALFTAPLLIAWAIFRFAGPDFLGDASHGTLVVPPRPLADAALYAPTGERGRLHGKWSLVYWSEGRCLAPCERQLQRMQRIWRGVGKYAPRLQRVLLLEGADPPGLADPELARRLQRYPGQMLWLPGAEQRASLLMAPVPEDSPRRDAGNDQAAGAGGGHLYVVDPLGNLVVRYAPDADSGGIVKDLKRLLRVSRIG